MLKTISIDTWYEKNKNTIDNIYDTIIHRIMSECSIPTYYDSYYTINEDRLYHKIVEYLYKVSNSVYKHSYHNQNSITNLHVV